MSHQVARVRRDVVTTCMSCLLCNNLLQDATTVSECLHTFCKKCIYKKLIDEDTNCCPTCKIDLGCAPLEKLRPDHNLEDIMAKIFPAKSTKGKAPEIGTSSAALPSKRKERSMSSLVINSPKVSSQSRMPAGRRSKPAPRKASMGSSFTREKTIIIDDSTSEEEPDSSPEVMTKNTHHNRRRKPAVPEPPRRPIPDKGREDGSESSRNKADMWKPLNCLMEAANRSKPSNFSTKQSVVELHSSDNEGLPSKTKNKENKQKSKLKDEKIVREIAPPEPERRKSLRKTRPPKKAQQYVESRFSPQNVLEATKAKSEKRNYPIWFSLVAVDELEGDESPLPQIPGSYLRIKDGNMPVSFIQKYLKKKLYLSSEDEVEIKCMGQSVSPKLTLNNLIDLWLATTSSEKISTTIGSSAKDFVMVLGYARRDPDY